MAIAVPVRKFSRNQLAFSGTPFSANQFATSKMFPAIKIVPMIPITMIFLIPKLIICPFKKYYICIHMVALLTDERKRNLKKFLSSLLTSTYKVVAVSRKF
jgi:hypothetical protein